MTLPFGYGRKMAIAYGGKKVEVRLLESEVIDFTSPEGTIARTDESFFRKALVGEEKRDKEGHVRNFRFLVEDYPEDPPSTTTRLVVDGLTFEIKSYTTDGVVFDIHTYRP